MLDAEQMAELMKAEQDKLIEGAHVEMDLKLKQASDLSKAYASDPELWKLDNLISIATKNLFQRLTSDIALQATFTASVQGMIRELSEANDTPLIRRYIEVVAVCWFRYQVAQGGYPGVQHEMNWAVYKVLDFWDRHLAAVQGQYLKALDALARAKRLPLPVFQVNIADKQQVNVGLVSKATKGKAP